MEDFILSRINKGIYKSLDNNTSSIAFDNKNGWTDYVILGKIIFSHRTVDYTTVSFPDSLHSHDYFELVVFCRGENEYVNENNLLIPQNGDIVINKVGEIHTTRLKSESIYERFVLYFTKEAFSMFSDSSLLNFLDENQCFIRLEEKNIRELFLYLTEIEHSLSQQIKDSDIVAYGSLLKLFFHINRYATRGRLYSTIPSHVAKIKNYIDENYTIISSVSEIAEHFYYSREYTSKSFKQYFNTTISDYIRRRRIEKSKQLLSEGYSVTDVCYMVGFRNLTSFISSFKGFTGITPSRFK